MTGQQSADWQKKHLINFELGKFDPKKVRIVFLDIDGVLISMRTMLTTGYWPNVCQDLSVITGKKTIKPPYVNHADCIDKTAVHCLNLLLESTDAYIVLSSSWREGLSVYQIREVLKAMGINPKRVMGRTSAKVIGETQHTRGDQIWNFIQGMKEKRMGEYGDYFVSQGFLVTSLMGVEMDLDSYVIIDDAEEFRFDQATHLVRTTEDDGLTLAHVLQAGRTLTGKPFEVVHLKYGEDTNRRLITVSA